VLGAAGPAFTVLWLALAQPLSPAQSPAAPANADDPDQLYRRRDDLASAMRAADLWETHSTADFEAAWKLSRICYWLGTHAPQPARRKALERGINAGETAIRLAFNLPEGHFWLAANMGALADSFGIMAGLKYRGRIKSELERVLAINPGWEGGSAEAAIGRWYFEVPRLFGGSEAKAEEHLRRALEYDPRSLVALSFLAELVAADGRRDEARTLLQRVLDAPVDPEWMPEDIEYKKQATARLQALGR
jgi:tetratricopeptide (TPR) repeat protein